MTVSSTPRKVGPFLGNGVTTAFPFTFKVFTTADVALTRTDASGAVTTLTLGTDYGIALNADQDNNPGGTITYPLAGSPMAAGQTMSGLGSLKPTQGTDLTSLGRFLPQVIEDALDKLTILSQQQIELLARALLVPASDIAAPVALPGVLQRLDKVFGFDSLTGQPVASTFTLTQLASVVAAVYAAAAGPLDALSFIQGGAGAVSRSAQVKLREQNINYSDFGMTAATTAAQNTVAMLAARTYMQSRPNRLYRIGFPDDLAAIQHQDAKFLQGVRDFILEGGGRTIQNTLVSSSTTEKIPIWLGDIFLDNAGTPAGYGTEVSGYLVNAATKGDKSITLTTPGDAANFAANMPVLLYGYNQTSSGYPPSMRYFDYLRVKSVVGAVVTFYEPIDNSYRTDWIDLQTDSNAFFGKARLLPLERPGYNIIRHAEINDLNFLPSNGYVDDGTGNSLGGSLYGSGCLDLTVRRCYIPGFFYPTMGKNARIEGGWVRFTEIDKVIDRVVFSDVKIQEVSNGPACNKLVLERGRVMQPIANLNCKDFEAEGTRFVTSTTAGQFINPAASIRMDSLKVINCLFDTVDPREDSKVAPSQAGATSTQIILDPASSAVDSFYNGMQVSILSGTGIRQIRTISAYVGATKVATVSAAWTTQPDSTSGYRLDRVVPILSAGSTVSITVIAATAPNKITCAYTGLGDPAIKGLSVGSVLKSTTTSTKIRVSQVYYDGVNTVVEGVWVGGTPGAAEVFTANICGQVVIENPRFLTTQDEYRNNTLGSPMDYIASGNSATNFDEVRISDKHRTDSQIIVPYVFFRDKTASSTMFINVNSLVYSIEVDVETAYTGASGTATLIITRRSTEGTTPYTQTINLKNAGTRSMNAATAGAQAGDTLAVVPPRFHKQIAITCNNDLSDAVIVGKIRIQTAPPT